MVLGRVQDELDKSPHPLVALKEHCEPGRIKKRGQAKASTTRPHATNATANATEEEEGAVNISRIRDDTLDGNVIAKNAATVPVKGPVTFDFIPTLALERCPRWQTDPATLDYGHQAPVPEVVSPQRRAQQQAT